jgi:carboxyl-terminal processing protease
MRRIYISKLSEKSVFAAFAAVVIEMSKKISLSIFIFVLLAAILVSFMSAFFVAYGMYRKGLTDAYLENNSPDDQQKESRFPELEVIDSIFKTYSYFDLDDKALIDAVLSAYARATDDRYAEYYNAEQYEMIMSESTGEMQGIGINIEENTEHNAIEVLNVMPDSPALEAGLMPGDLIVYVGIGEERESIAELGYYPAVKKLQGLAGTYAEFTVRRGDEEIEFSILRGYVTTQSVLFRKSDLDPSVGVVKILNFDLTTPTQFSNAVDTLLAEGIEKFVFDLRYNPGGDLLSIEAVLSYFLNEGDVMISTIDKAGNKDTDVVRAVSYDGKYQGCSVHTGDIGKYRRLKCVVIVNNSTASAAELFTANFRDYKLAPIVGVTTFGKGSMQSLFPLDYFGYEGGIKLTTKMYFPPSGESYEGIGITPDIIVELSEEAKNTSIYKLADKDDAQMQAAVQILQEPERS